MTPEHMKTTPEDIDLDRMKDDTISRQAVLKLLSAMPPEEATTKAILIQSVQQMNSAQLEVAKDANVLTNDCISRQEAIDALRTHDRKASKKWFDNQLDIEWNNAIDICCYDIEDLPSAQPETAKRIAETAQNVSDEDLISRKAAIDAIRASTSKYTGFMEMEMYTDDDAVEAIEALPSAQPDKEKISDSLYNVYRNKGTSTSAEGVAAIKYYIAEIWREIYGEEGPKWLKK